MLRSFKSRRQFPNTNTLILSTKYSSLVCIHHFSPKERLAPAIASCLNSTGLSHWLSRVNSKLKSWELRTPLEPLFHSSMPSGNSHGNSALPGHMVDKCQHLPIFWTSWLNSRIAGGKDYALKSGPPTLDSLDPSALLRLWRGYEVIFFFTQTQLLLCV